MTPAEIAQKVAQHRRAQFNALRPAYAEARQSREKIRALRAGATETRARVETVQSFRHVPGFFPTPKAIAERMAELAGLRAGWSVLEPSCGNGRLAEVIRSRGCIPYLIESNPGLAQFTRGMGFEVNCCDFMQHDPGMIFDCVLMNPPFELAQDVKHIRRALQMVKPGAAVVAICANGPRQQELKSAADYWELLPAGTFRESGTEISTVLLRIEK